MNERRCVVVGGGAAGFFAAIACAEARLDTRVILLEKTQHFLAKVRISGGGRCNVTHACFDPRVLRSHYPRGGTELLGPFQVFQPSDTIAWFEDRGVKLKTESDGRIFPVSDSSTTIIDCLMQAASKAGVQLLNNRGVDQVKRRPEGGFQLVLSDGATIECEHLMLATGGCRGRAAGQLAESLGHRLEPPVPSLFTFHVDAGWLGELAGISLPTVDVQAPGFRLTERGAVLITHEGLSGPAILRLSAWGARPMHSAEYRFPLRLNWLPQLKAEALMHELESRRTAQPARFLVNTPFAPLPSRLWERLVVVAGIARETRWAALSHTARHRLVQQLQATELQVIGKSLNKDEFVTCGGVRLDEVNFKRMESRICPALHFGGELLDIDGVTGGFNFQAAWTTGWIAGHAMASA